MPRIAALDPGQARIGVAVSDELGMLAHPRPAIDARDRKRSLERLAKLAADEEIEKFIVGLPLDMRGDEGDAARKARAFAQSVADATERPVELVDERLTTVEAGRRLREGGTDARKGKRRIDGAAAAVLLQAWLDRGPAREP
jgi:putative Holliday junction resolvase